MIYPTITELTKGELNRYELVIGVAKACRMVNDEYTAEFERTEELRVNRENDRAAALSAAALPAGIPQQKPITVALERLKDGSYELEKPCSGAALAAGEEQSLLAEAEEA